MLQDKKHLQKLYRLRQEIHQYPEISGNEYNTIKKIIEFIKEYHPHKIVTELGNTGAAFIYEGIEKGKTIIIRADIDALPIQENNNIAYASCNKNIAHLCGHDGHIAIVAGLAKLLHKEKPEKGKVVLLFQPAEETGKGAKMILADKKFHNLEPDYIFALHNLPGFEKNTIIIKNNTFSSSSTGVIINLTGIKSHASEPEKGNSPLKAFTEIINKLNNINKENLFAEDTFITIVHAALGTPSFGINPAEATIMATLRSADNNEFDKLIKQTVNIIKTTAAKYNIKSEIKWTEDFCTIENDPFCTEIIEEIAKHNGMEIIKTEKPFRWSEDFGLFTNIYKGAMFGLGAGKNSPPLHNPEYDFPDEIIEAGITMFYSIIKKTISDKI